MASLASSPQSEARFDAILARWTDATSATRATLRPQLDDLVRDLEKQGDSLEPMARAYLAIAWLDAGVPAAAEATARPLVEGPPGVSNDLGVLVKGAAARRQGRAAEAIELLRPLVGKLIDPFARPILYEEITEAFLDDQRWDDAIVYAEGWLRSASGGTPAEQKQVKAAVTRVLHRIPEAVALRVLDAEAATPPEARHSPDLIMILAARVDEGSAPVSDDAGLVAIDGGADAPAVAVVDAAPVPATTIPAMAPIRFDPRTIAVLLPSSLVSRGAAAASAVRAAAAVATPSLAQVLHADAGVDANVAVAPSGHRLAVFDTAATTFGVTKALEAAEREGAGVVIGGMTDLEANALAALAQNRRIATVLLRRPSVPPTLVGGERQQWIALGSTEAEDRQSTLAVAPAGTIAVVDAWPDPGAPPASDDPLHARCDAQPKSAGGPAFPVAEWKTRKVAAIVVLGDARCARRVVDDVVASKPQAWHPLLVAAPTALEIAHVALPLPRSVVAGGLLPATDAAPPSLRTLWIDQGGPVGWAAALCHDATVLAAAALPGDLPATSETAAIQKARATTLSRLFAAKGELWTTTAAGPNGNGLVPHSASLRSVAAGSAVAPSWAPP